MKSVLPEDKRPKIGLLPALSTNILNMVGVGPFITIPLVLSAMGGPQAMLGWGAGALLALCDGLVWAELGAAMPVAGGSYTYLREAFGSQRWGRFMSFLFLMQTVMAAPLTAASGAVGFAEYASYLVPLSHAQSIIVAVAVCLLSTFLLYRNIKTIGTFSIVLTAVVLGTIGVIIGAGATHFNAQLAFDFPAGAFHLSPNFFMGLGASTLIAMYDYSGYFNICLLGDEVKAPAKNLPRSILLSIVLLGLCYAAMSLSIIGVLPWQQAAQSHTVISDFMAHLYGSSVARLTTMLILVAAFGSVYCVLLGFSRVPYAAAVEGNFFRAFARVHPTKQFPSFSVLFLGLASAAACLLTLGNLIKSLLVLQILTQFVAQCVGLVLLRRRRAPRPFAMPLYPVPVVVAVLGWLSILASSGRAYLLVGFASVAGALLVFLYWSSRKRQWPFLACF